MNSLKGTLKMNFFIVEQINGEGNSTGLTKMIKGALEASKFIMREESDDSRKQKIADSIRKMQPGDFDAINSGKYIYEVDCVSEKDDRKSTRLNSSHQIIS